MRAVCHGVEETVRRQVVDPVGAYATDPTDRSWCHDGFERIVAKTVLIFDGVVDHECLSPLC